MSSKIWKRFFLMLIVALAIGCKQESHVAIALPEKSNSEVAGRDAVETNHNFAVSSIHSKTTDISTNALNDPLLIWQSPSSTADERANAANLLLAPNVTINSVEAQLGKGRHFTHCFGPSLASTNGVDFWLLEYGAPDGLVELQFSRLSGMTNLLGFERAYAESVQSH